MTLKNFLAIRILILMFLLKHIRKQIGGLSGIELVAVMNSALVPAKVIRKITPDLDEKPWYQKKMGIDLACG